MNKDNQKHQAVLVKEVIEALNPQKNCYYIDATFGAGGHSREILNRGAKVIAFDFDQQSIDQAKKVFSKEIDSKQLILIRENFNKMDESISNLKKSLEFEISGIFFDFGTSTDQLMSKDRGFSFEAREETLDMRMDDRLGVKACDPFGSCAKLKVMKNIKKKLPLIVVAVVLLIVGSILLINKNKKSDTTNSQISTKKKVQSPVNIIPVTERPYLRLEPSSDGHYITITVAEVKKTASQLDYEMEYQTGSMLQGFGGLIKLDKLPVSDKKLFGSQSAGGAITYHEDIKGGNLLAQFTGSENYAVKSAWRYFTNSTKASEFTSQDTKFIISNKELNKYSYFIIYNSPGYPAEIKGELLSDPYVVSAEKSLKTISGKFEVSIRASEASQIMGYDGSKWQKMDSTYANGLVKASGALMDVYVVIKK